MRKAFPRPVAQMIRVVPQLRAVQGVDEAAGLDLHDDSFFHDEVRAIAADQLAMEYDVEPCFAIDCEPGVLE